jgi:hypothetical protein
MFIQTYHAINTIHPYEGNGCKISSYFYWSEQLRRTGYSAKEINALTTIMMDRGLLTEDLAVLYDERPENNPELQVPLFLGIPVKEARREPANYVPKLDEIAILRLDKPGYEHFVPGYYAWGRGFWYYTWDSLGVRPGREKYKITGIRIMKLEVGALGFPLSSLNPVF